MEPPPPTSIFTPSGANRETFSMKTLLIAASAAALVAGCASTYNEPPLAPEAALDPMSPLAAPGYMAMAASSDMFEIESSRLALQMSRNPAVRQFAQMMIADHSRTTNEMLGIASSLGLPPPPQGMAPHHRDMLDRLRSASPGDFDRAYKAEQIMAHQEALALHRNYAADGDSGPLREFAARVVPAIEMHYQHAQTLPETAMMQHPQHEAPVRAGERG